MAAPNYVPVALGDRPRAVEAPLGGHRWWANRPADLQHGQPLGPGMGRPGPDQGYALKLARRFEERLSLADGVAPDDAVAAAVAVALKRASVLGRAPVVHDLDLAFRLLGLLGTAPPDLVEWRRPYLVAASHNYPQQRRLADLVSEATLRLTPDQVGERVASGAWRQLFEVSS